MFSGLKMGTSYGYRSGMTVLTHLLRDLPGQVTACQRLTIDEQKWTVSFGDASPLLARVASDKGFATSKGDPAFRAALAAAHDGGWRLAGAKLAAFVTHAGTHLE